MCQYYALEVEGRPVAGLCVLCLRNVGQDHALRKLQVLCSVHRGALHNKECFPAEWNGSGVQILPRAGFPKSKTGEGWAGWLPKGLSLSQVSKQENAV